MLTRDRILGLLGTLETELRRRGVRGEIFVVGGAAMVLAYDARPATEDVDAIFKPATEVRAAAHAVAAREGDVDEDWLNDAVKGLLPPGDQGEVQVVFDAEFLSVTAGSPQYLLATKLFASRMGRDDDDARLLLQLANITTVGEGLDLVERYYPGRPLEAKIGFFLQQILES